jgi:hypothetical protein
MENIYRYHAVQKDGWRFNFSTNPNLGEGWIYDGLAFKVPNQSAYGAVPVYQFHFDQKHTYGGWRFLYSTSENHVKQGWVMDRVAFYAFLTEKNGTIPIYQYHCQQKDGWRFHLCQSANVKQGWTKD